MKSRFSIFVAAAALAALLSWSCASSTSARAEEGGKYSADDGRTSTGAPAGASTATAPRDKDGGASSEETLFSETERDYAGASDYGDYEGKSGEYLEDEFSMPADGMPAPDYKTSGAPMPSTGGTGGYRPPSESGLKAGFSDDNEQFNYFVNFLEEYGDVDHYPLNVQERISLKVLDAAGKPVANAALSVLAGNRVLAKGRSYSNGLFHLYPLEYDDANSYVVQVSYGKLKQDFKIQRNGPREVSLGLQGLRNPPAPLPMDILFVLDTTGSMGEEIERLKDNIEIIQANVSAVTPKPAVRFGLVLYKDRGDEYVTRRVPFTADLASFMDDLNLVDADGGGDTPEDLQTALRDAMQKMDWNDDGLRLAFVITDAEAHLDYGQTYTYASAARDAKARGIKLYSVGTGGLGIEGEYLLRQISQYTAARYIFLTYGEHGESAGGVMGSVSHHTGSNFQTDKLEAIIIRFAREELAWQSDEPLVEDEPYFDAQKIPDETREETLAKLFEEALGNLSDYSTFKLEKAARCAFLPVALGTTDSTPALLSQAEYFSAQLLMAASASKLFTVVDRSKLQEILKEQSLQLSGIVDEATASKVGKLLGADYMVSGTLFEREGRWEIFLQLLRVETGEVLSVTKAKLSKDLGL